MGISSLPVDHVAEVDELGRAPFARYLLELLTRVDVRSGAVVGLEGEWGTGKTWVMRRIEPMAQELPKHERPLFIEFNPWRVTGANDLVASLLHELIGQIGAADLLKPQQRSKLVNSLVSFTKLLSKLRHLAPVANLVVPGAGSAAELAGQAGEAMHEVATAGKDVHDATGLGRALSLAASRKGVDTALRSYKGRIVVVVDDLDRLPPAEVVSIVQAVKAVADFPQVVYLLAYSRAAVAHALESALQIQNGDAYIEKIVQLSVPMPEVPARRMQQSAIKRLCAAFDNVALNPSEKEDLEHAVPLAASLMRTPRDVARLETRLFVVAAPLLGEVNLADVLVAEALAQRAPAFLPWMRKHGRILFHFGLATFDTTISSRGLHGDDMADFHVESTKRQELREARIEELYALFGHESALQVPAKTALKWMFASLSRVRGGRAGHSAYLRLQNFRYWYRWQCLCDHQEALTTQQVVALLQEPHRLKSEGYLGALEPFYYFCRNVCDLGLVGVESVDAGGLVDALVEAERALGWQVVVDWQDHYGAPAALIVALRFDGTVRRHQALSRLIAEASVTLSGTVLCDVLEEMKAPARIPEVFRDRPVIATEQIADSLRCEWLKVAEQALSAGKWRLEDGGCSAYRVLVLMSYMRSSDKNVRAVATGALSRNEDDIARFFSAFADGDWSDHFPPQIDWGLLPERAVMQRLIDQAESFRQSHSRFCKAFDSHCARADEGLAARPAADV